MHKNTKNTLKNLHKNVNIKIECDSLTNLSVNLNLDHAGI